MKPRFFKSPSDFREWLAEHHASKRELLLGFQGRLSGKAGITYKEALDEALCFGWIDGVRKSVGEGRYTIRFTPRRDESNWSLVNTRRVRELIALDRMRPPGLLAYERRDENKTRRTANERGKAALSPDHERTFRADERAWAFFQSQPPWYRRTATWWVISAKQEETRRRRLSTLIELSAQGLLIPLLGRRPKAGK